VRQASRRTRLSLYHRPQERPPGKQRNLRTIATILKTYRSEWPMFAFIAQMLASPLADKYPHVGVVLALSLFGLILFGSPQRQRNRIVVEKTTPQVVVD
jgi:hypothetical protein